MLLFSTKLDIVENMTIDDFISLVIEWMCFVNKDSSKSEGKFPIYGLGIPHFRKETYC